MIDYAGVSEMRLLPKQSCAVDLSLNWGDFGVEVMDSEQEWGLCLFFFHGNFFFMKNDKKAKMRKKKNLKIKEPIGKFFGRGARI